MTATAERGLLTRAEDLADTADLAGQIITIIGRARAARVDQDALGGLTAAVRALGGDVTALFRAARGRHPDGAFSRDTDLLEAVAEAEDAITGRISAASRLRRQAEDALQQAQDDEEAAAAELARARRMPAAEPCQGCHGARASAIQAAQREIDDARERAGYASAALEVIAPLSLGRALQAVRRVPDDLHEVYTEAYGLVTRDSRALPKDGDFITGQKTAAAMAAGMLAARVLTAGPAEGVSAAVKPQGTYYTRGETPSKFAHGRCLPASEITTVLLPDLARGFTNGRGTQEYPLIEHRQQNDPWCWAPRWGSPEPCTFCGEPVE